MLSKGQTKISRIVRDRHLLIIGTQIRLGVDSVPPCHKYKNKKTQITKIQMKEMIQGVLEPSISHLGFPFLLCFFIQTYALVATLSLPSTRACPRVFPLNHIQGVFQLYTHCKFDISHFISKT